jgi:hypothetical protein
MVTEWQSEIPEILLSVKLVSVLFSISSKRSDRLRVILSCKATVSKELPEEKAVTPVFTI